MGPKIFHVFIIVSEPPLGYSHIGVEPADEVLRQAEGDADEHDQDDDGDAASSEENDYDVDDDETDVQASELSVWCKISRDKECDALRTWGRSGGRI